MSRFRPTSGLSRDFQISNRFPFEYHGWKKCGTAPVEYLDWQRHLPIESDGKLLLSRDSVMQVAIHNSRDYQTTYESLYLTALALTQARFQFMVQGFSTSSWLGQTLGYGKTQDDQLQLNSLNGFNLQLMTGAQMLVSMANSLVFNYTGKGFEVASPNLVINFTQPLLRGAWAGSSPRGLSLQERGVLYALRICPLPPYVLRWPGRRERLPRGFEPSFRTSATRNRSSRHLPATTCNTRLNTRAD